MPSPTCKVQPSFDEDAPLAQAQALLYKKRSMHPSIACRLCKIAMQASLKAFCKCKKPCICFSKEPDAHMPKHVRQYFIRSHQCAKMYLLSDVYFWAVSLLNLSTQGHGVLHGILRIQEALALYLISTGSCRSADAVNFAVPDRVFPKTRRPTCICNFSNLQLCCPLMREAKCTSCSSSTGHCTKRVAHKASLVLALQVKSATSHMYSCRCTQTSCFALHCLIPKI